jgi:hypothetical protein
VQPAAGGSGGARGALRACGACRSRSALLSCCALRAGQALSARVAFRSLRTRRAGGSCGPGQARGSGGSLRPGVALRSCQSGVPLGSLRTLRARVALRALRSGRTLRPGLPRWSCGACGSRRARLTRGACRTGSASRSCWTFRPGRTLHRTRRRPCSVPVTLRLLRQQIPWRPTRRKRRTRPRLRSGHPERHRPPRPVRQVLAIRLQARERHRPVCGHRRRRHLTARAVVDRYGGPRREQVRTGQCDIRHDPDCSLPDRQDRLSPAADPPAPAPSPGSARPAPHPAPRSARSSPAAAPGPGPSRPAPAAA